MTAPLVSILVPCHNAAPWLRATLDSALAQTHPRTEVIVIDDGSRDDSLALARTYESRGVRVVAQPNRGASAARNHALRLATGDWIQFLDADDLLAPDKIARQLARAVSAPAGAVFTARWARFVDDPAAAVVHAANPLFADLAPREYLLRYATIDCMMHPGAWLLPRTVTTAAGPWDERLSLNDDGEYFARIVAASSAVLHCPEALSLYRSGLPTSLSGQRTRRHLESAHLAATLTAAHLQRVDQGPDMRTAAADLLQRFAYDYYPAAPDLVADAERQARALGPARFAPLGGRAFHLLRHLVGWKRARRLQVAAGRFAAPVR